MVSLVGEKVPLSARPRPENYRFDLDGLLARVVGIHSIIPSDGFTAETLGAERAGNGVVIDDGLVLTIGYLINEAQTVWLHLDDGRVVQGDPLGIDHETGFGLVQALGKLDVEPFTFGDSDTVRPGDNVVIGGVGGRSRSVAGKVFTRESFEGYWEYALDDALFTTPSHPNWGGSALISESGELVGIGSLQLERSSGEGKSENANMFVPINLLKPVLSDLRKFGRVNRQIRPWLGIFSTELDGQVILAGINPRGPAARAELKEGDVILAVGGRPVSSLRNLYRTLWAQGPAGTDITLTLRREGDTFDVSVASIDRTKLLKRPRMH
jgi:S1-C subfamily serine protease